MKDKIIVAILMLLVGGGTVACQSNSTRFGPDDCKSLAATVGDLFDLIESVALDNDGNAQELRDEYQRLVEIGLAGGCTAIPEPEEEAQIASS